MRRWLSRVGLVLSLAAYSLLAFHQDHGDPDHGSPQHHCCPCHLYTTTPNETAAVVAKTPFVERLSFFREADAATLPVLGAASPRAPPVA